MIVHDIQTGYPVSLLARNGGLVVTNPNQQQYIELMPAMPANTDVYSQVYVLPQQPRPRYGVAAQYLKPAGGGNFPVGAEIEIEWSLVATGGIWYPSVSSSTGTSRSSESVATAEDRSLISRGQPSGNFFRVRINVGANAVATDGPLVIQVGPF